MTTGTSLNALRQQHEEWSPWLAVVEQALAEIDGAAWHSAAASVECDHATLAADRPATRPVLVGALFVVRRRAMSRLLKRLIGRAAESGTPRLATLTAMVDHRLELLPLLRASVCQDSAYVEHVAASRRTDAEATQAVVALAAVPLLQACRRRFEHAISKSWAQPYCPICGAWPVFAEERGIERSRCFRCGRCGGEWYARTMCCAYCGETDHDALATLVPERGRTDGVIEACRQCSGYVKVLTRLQGCAPASVLLDDLATVALDIAARSAGYVRPGATGYPLDVNVREPRAIERLSAWKG